MFDPSNWKKMFGGGRCGGGKRCGAGPGYAAAYGGQRRKREGKINAPGSMLMDKMARPGHMEGGHGLYGRKSRGGVAYGGRRNKKRQGGGWAALASILGPPVLQALFDED
jgi:hypothetical protein